MYPLPEDPPVGPGAGGLLSHLWATASPPGALGTSPLCTGSLGIFDESSGQSPRASMALDHTRGHQSHHPRYLHTEDRKLNPGVRVGFLEERGQCKMGR